MKNTVSNQEIARAAAIYYAKKEGEKIARKKAAEEEKAQKKAEKAAKKAKKAVDEFTDSVKDLNNSENKETKQQSGQQKAKKESFFGNVFKKKEDIIDVEATVIDVEQPKEEAKEQPKQETKEQSKKEQPKTEVEVVETVKAEKKDAGRAAKDVAKKPVENKEQKQEKKAVIKQEQPKKEEGKKAEATVEAEVDPAEKEHPEDDAPEVEEVKAEKKAEESKEEKKETEVAETVTAKTGKSVEAAAAANNLGFNIQHWVKEETPVEQAVSMHSIIGQHPTLVQAPNVAAPVYQQPTPQQQTQAIKNPVEYFMNQSPMQQETTQLDVSKLYPVNYQQLGAADKCTAIEQMCNSNGIPMPFDPMSQADMSAKVEELKKHIKFIEGRHKGVHNIQIAGLLTLIDNPLLRTKMTEYGSKDRPNNPKLYEVELSKYGRPGDETKYDMCFEINLKEKGKHMFVLFNSVPEWNPNTRSWNHTVEFGKK